jgi:integrase-like protein
LGCCSAYCSRLRAGKWLASIGTVCADVAHSANALIESGSIGSVGDALDNALMESAIGLYKTQLNGRDRSWTGQAEVERETATWVHWYNATRMH